MEKNNTYPLFDFFLELRPKYLLHLDDYYAFLSAINQGLGIESEDALLRLCRCLWSKKQDDSEWFDNSFHNSFNQIKQRLTAILEKQEQTNDSQSEKPKPQEIPDKITDNDKDSETSEQKKDKKTDTSNSQTQTNLVPDYETVYLSMGQDANAVQSESQQNELKSTYHFTFSHRNFLPFAERPLQIHWRSLRNMVYEPDFETIDVAACTANIAQKGFLSEIFYEHTPKNKMQLVTIVDNWGSMGVFRWLSSQITDIISSQIKNEVYYCYNLPEPFLYSDTEMKTKKEWRNFREKLNGKHVIFISDAGAAKGNYSSARIKRTKEILNDIRRIAKNVVWLNPMPEHRWRKTSAIYISLAVQMYEISENGLQQTIHYLKNNIHFQPIL